MNRTLFLSLVITAAIAMTACDGGDKSPSATQPGGREAATASAPQALPATLFAKEAPAAAMPLHAARAQAKVGQPIVFTGYAGGRAEPFTDGRAVFLVTDAEKAPACTDGCDKPWDACCQASETVAANSASVQVVDEQGQMLKVGLNGQGGLKPGSKVAVAGKVRDLGENRLVVDAQTITVLPD